MVRSENQDAFGKFPEDDLDLATPKGQLFVIADGMGGHAGGREASRLAVEIIGESYFSSDGPIMTSLKKSFFNANQVIYDYSLNNPQFRGMGTTCIALVLHKSAAFAAHIGDSRLYRISEKNIEQLTRDHSKVAEMVRRGIITAEEGRVHPERSMLYRAMGVRHDVEFDVLNSIELGTDEYFLMCTDGLTSYLDDEELKEITLSHPLQGACDKMVDLANRRGGHDNITVQLVHVKGSDSFLKTVFGSR
jgi:serine/threonine protein phosphatase PrpC